MPRKLSLLVRGSSFRVIQTIVGMIAGFLLMPFLIRHLGREHYGLWVLVSSVAATYYLLDVGFNQAVARFVTKDIHKKDFQSANRVINTALLIYSGLGFCVLILSGVFAFVGAVTLVDDPKNLSLVQFLLLILGLQLAIEFPCKAFPGVINAYLRFDLTAMVRTARILADACLIYLVVISGFGLVAIAVTTFVTGLISNYAYVRIVHSLYSEVEYSAALVDRATIKELFDYSKWVFLNDTSSMLHDKVDVWTVAYFLGNSVLTIYYVAVRLIDFGIALLNQAVGITLPIFTEYFAKEQWDRLRLVLTTFIKLNLALALLMMCGFYAVGELFIRLWMGSDFPYAQCWHALIVLCVGRLAVFVTSPLQCILLTFGRHSIAARIAVVELISIAVLCAYLTPKYGIVGAAWSVTIPSVVARLVVLVVAVNSVFRFLTIELVIRAIAYSSAVAVLLYWLVTGVVSSEGDLRHLLGNSVLVAIAVIVASPILLSVEESKYAIRIAAEPARQILAGRRRH